jgi:amino acid transporter
MSILGKHYLKFDQEDVRLMQDMMKKFHELHQSTGMPDFSINYAGYLPVFTIALLSSQESVERLTKRLVFLTWMLATLTIIVTVLTVALLFRNA